MSRPRKKPAGERRHDKALLRAMRRALDLFDAGLEKPAIVVENVFRLALGIVTIPLRREAQPMLERADRLSQVVTLPGTPAPIKRPGWYKGPKAAKPVNARPPTLAHVAATARRDAFGAIKYDHVPRCEVIRPAFEQAILSQAQRRTWDRPWAKKARDREIAAQLAKAQAEAAAKAAEAAP